MWTLLFWPKCVQTLVTDWWRGPLWNLLLAVRSRQPWSSASSSSAQPGSDGGTGPCACWRTACRTSWCRRDCSPDRGGEQRSEHTVTAAGVTDLIYPACKDTQRSEGDKIRRPTQSVWLKSSEGNIKHTDACFSISEQNITADILYISCSNMMVLTDPTQTRMLQRLQLDPNTRNFSFSALNGSLVTKHSSSSLRTHTHT